MRAAEFFAGIGLVRKALESSGFQVVWANDHDPKKLAMYRDNFGAKHFHLEDIRAIRGYDLPDIDLATASFPCTDLSLAGNRGGLHGTQSGVFWEFTRVLGETYDRKPHIVMLENVPSFATSHGGQDLYFAIKELNRLGYWCDLFVIDARHFIPQSRPRLFIVGSLEQIPGAICDEISTIRPAWICKFAVDHPDLNLQAVPLTLPPPDTRTLVDIIERFDTSDHHWWSVERQERFHSELSPINLERLRRMMSSPEITWATAYRRTRQRKPVWEIRDDNISGCLRAVRGGSSKQAVVEAGSGDYRVRWMSAREYARLQGADGFSFTDVSESQALFGFGDAVCVPVVVWIASTYLKPLLAGEMVSTQYRQEELLSVG